MRNVDPKGIPLAKSMIPTITIEAGDGVTYCAYKSASADLYVVEKFVETTVGTVTTTRYYQGSAMVAEADIQTAEYAPAFYDFQ